MLSAFFDLDDKKDVIKKNTKVVKKPVKKEVKKVVKKNENNIKRGRPKGLKNKNHKYILEMNGEKLNILSLDDACKKSKINKNKLRHLLNGNEKVANEFIGVKFYKKTDNVEEKKEPIKIEPVKEEIIINK